jgi:hypothetical protein
LLGRRPLRLKNLIVNTLCIWNELEARRLILPHAGPLHSGVPACEGMRLPKLCTGRSPWYERASEARR